MRLCFFSSLLVSILLAGVPARAAVDDGTLGSRCAADGDCTGGLECVVVGEAFSRAPAGGLCTAPCLLDDECKPHGETALCSGSFCLEGCKTNTTTGPTLDPTKCHGREDMACIGFRCIVPGDTGCLETVDACMPMCAADEQCGPGLFCSHGAASVCQNTQPAGAPPGTACRYALSPETCAGLCDVDTETALMTGDDNAGVCTEPCVRGSRAACSAPVPSGRPRACVGSYIGYLGANGTGDVGKCVELCDCSSECRDNELCSPQDFGGRYPFAGICTRGARQPGAPDCLGAECNPGDVRACSVGDCIGTSRCQDDGTYSECECGDAGAPGPGANPPAAASDDSGCSVAHGASSGLVGAWLALLLAGLIRRRARG